MSVGLAHPQAGKLKAFNRFGDSAMSTEENKVKDEYDQ